jgi:hypothetical protein
MTQFAYGPDARHDLDLYGARRVSDATVMIFFYGSPCQGGLKSLNRPLALSPKSHGYVVTVRVPPFLDARAAQALDAEALR